MSTNLCYLRSIPVQPSLDHFHKTNKKAPNIFDISVFVKAEKCANGHLKVENFDNIQLPPEYLLDFSAKFESIQQFYGSNVIISTLNTISNYHSSPAPIIHEPDSSKLEVVRINNLSSLQRNYILSSEIRSLVGRKARVEARLQNSNNDFDDDTRQKIEAKVNTLDISNIYFKTLNKNKTAQTRKTINRNIGSWIKDQKRKWNKDSFYRNVRTIF